MAETAAPLNRTPLHDLHVSLGAKVVPFAGYEMPVQYPDGIMAEHRWTRESAGLFDVSHMGQVRIAGVDADAALERLVPGDLKGLGVGQMRYTLFTNDAGGVLDDLMATRVADGFLLVVNAACKHADLAHLQRGLGAERVEARFDRGLLALQGPKAVAALGRHAPGSARLTFLTGGEMAVAGVPCFVTRSGYTGEDGFEIACPGERAAELARALLSEPEVKPIGLGARDSLRLEAGLCLYGHDIDTTTTPVEGALEWSVQKVRRGGSARAGGFPGADKILSQFAQGASRRRVGLRPEGRAPVREGALLFADPTSTEPIGKVTSGGFGPSLNAPVAMGYLPTALSALDTIVFAEVRGQRLPLKVAATPFVPNTYKR
jgi:aminomethyltransferase